MTNGPSNARQGKGVRKTEKRGKRGGDSFAKTSASGNEKEGKGGAKRNNNGDCSTSIIVARAKDER